jgi:hypothetical protein
VGRPPVHRALEHGHEVLAPHQGHERGRRSNRGSLSRTGRHDEQCRMITLLILVSIAYRKLLYKFYDLLQD